MKSFPNFSPPIYEVLLGGGGGGGGMSLVICLLLSEFCALPCHKFAISQNLLAVCHHETPLMLLFCTFKSLLLTKATLKTRNIALFIIHRVDYENMYSRIIGT